MQGEVTYKQGLGITHRIGFIKLVRDAYPIGLKDARDLVVEFLDKCEAAEVRPDRLRAIASNAVINGEYDTAAALIEQLRNMGE